MSFDHFLTTLLNLDHDSSPGIPYCYKYQTIGDFLGHSDTKFLKNSENIRSLYQRVLQIPTLKFSDLHPYRLFIKDEPHSQKKISSNRFRLIANLSLDMQVFQQMLFSTQNNREVANFKKLPFFVGFGPYGGGYKNIPTKGKFLCADKTAWDWTVHEWHLKAELAFRRKCCVTRGPLFNRWKKLAIFAYRAMFGPGNCVFQLSNGVRFRQTSGGIMKSGSVLTLPTNTHLQLLIHIMACQKLDVPIPRMISVGDDTSMELLPDFPVEAYLKATESLGCIVKEHKILENENEFCGMLFNERGNVEPLYQEKHLVKILSEPKQHILKGMTRDYATMYQKSTSPMKNVFGNLLSKHQPEVDPRDLLLVFEGKHNNTNIILA
uniref:RNA-dependent RNA polymerase n=1 Tax=Caenorhabditis remanei TaxID=31234 RepID=A0A5P9Q548_CAERE|nr:RNA-dependent RNA polymerase [Caenorhabditis remanei]